MNPTSNTHTDEERRSVAWWRAMNPQHEGGVLRVVRRNGCAWSSIVRPGLPTYHSEYEIEGLETILAEYRAALIEYASRNEAPTLLAECKAAASAVDKCMETFPSANDAHAKADAATMAGYGGGPFTVVPIYAAPPAARNANGVTGWSSCRLHVAAKASIAALEALIAWEDGILPGDVTAGRKFKVVVDLARKAIAFFHANGGAK